MIDCAGLEVLLEAWDLGGGVRCTALPHPGLASTTWWVETSTGHRYVAKWIHDGQEFAEPGLRVAAALDGLGIITGRPQPTRSGRLSLGVSDGASRGTLIVLQHVPGEPLNPAFDSAPRIAGELLGQVHAALQATATREWVPGDLLAWCARDSGTPGVRSVLRILGDFEQHTPLTRGVLYGDPAPEILVDGATQSVALIDWGTPSWGPLVHDVACWLRYLSSGGAPSGGRDPFLDAYRGYMRLDPAEFGALAIFEALHKALGLRSRW